METLSLASSYRETSGKTAARKLRAEGMIPAILYGHKDDVVPLAIEEKDLRRLLATNWETTIVGLKITGKVAKECDAIIKELQHHPASGRVIHVDFQYIRRGEKINLHVPVHLQGVPVGVKERGGILEHGPRELSIRCMPRHIPDSLDLDVQPLDFGDAVRVGDLHERYPDVEFLDDADTVLATVVPPKLEVETAVEEEEGAEAEEPEVIAKGKEEDAGKEGADKG